MKFLQTLWTGPSGSSDANPANIKAGWLSSEFHWMSWALSCLTAKNIFGEIHLETDAKGKEMLIDQLQLPYSTVSTGLEHQLDDYPKELFALAKIYTYSIQNGPFLHLDSDVYLWHKPDDSFLKSTLIAQNPDKNLPFYYQALNDINEHFTYIPSTFRKENYEQKNLYASNAGLLGGNHPQFFKEYGRQAFEFIDKNKHHLDKLNTGSLNFIFEQYLFCELAKKENIPIAYFKEMVDNPVFKDYIKFDDFPQVQMIHPVGNFKKYRHICNHVAKKLREDYPEYYYRVINVVRDSGVNMACAVYYTPQFKPEIMAPLIPGNAVDVSTAEPLFDRTRAAIKYLNHKYLPGEEMDADVDLSKDDFPVKFSSLLSNENDKDCLMDVYQLEFATNSLKKRLYNSTANIVRLYDEDRESYKRIQKTFSLPEADRMKVKLSVAKSYVLVEAGWDWKCDFKENIPAIIQRNFNEEQSGHAILLLPDVLQMDVREYHIDELDMIVFNTIKGNYTLEEILEEMKQYFSDEEVDADYLSFKKLMINIIKQLLYAGAVEIIF